MGILTYLLGSWAALGIGHKTIKKPLEELVEVNEDAITPARQKNDGRDFTPTNKYVLFGHHWMSVAGTTAIVASIIGLVWGWLPSLVWMLVGVHLIGATNDYFSLMLSVKNEGKSLGQIAKENINKNTGKLLSILYFVASILVTAMFIVVMTGTLVDVPDAGVPVLSLIPISMLFGICLKKGYPLLITTLACVVVILGVCGIGANYPLVFSYNTWLIIFVIYTLFAMTLPVWLLLAPRDYLNTTLVIGGMILAAVSLLIVRPPILMPAFVGFNSVRGPLWPMIMATITCGAASGVHGLISSGTTSKQLSNEKDGYFVAFGGMQGETLMAGISAAMIMVLFTYDQFLERAYVNAGAAFSAAMGNCLTMLGINPVWATTIGALTFSALLLTTLDSWARAGRYVMEEMAPDRSRIKKNVWASSALYMVIVVVVMLTVPYMDLWSGIAIGSLTLLLVPLALMLVKRYKENKVFDFKFVIFVLLPICIVYPSAVAAVLYQMVGFLNSRNWVSLAMLIFMICTIGFLTVYTVHKMMAIKRERREAIPEGSRYSGSC